MFILQKNRPSELLVIKYIIYCKCTVVLHFFIHRCFVIIAVRVGFFPFLYTFQLFHFALYCILNSNRDKESAKWSIASVASRTIFFIERLLQEMGVAGVSTMQQEYVKKIPPFLLTSEWGTTFNTLLDLSRQIIYRPHRERKKELERRSCVCQGGGGRSQRGRQQKACSSSLFFSMVYKQSECTNNVKLKGSQGVTACIMAGKDIGTSNEVEGQRAGPTRRPAWLAMEESDPAGCDFVRDGWFMPPALMDHATCPGLGDDLL